MKAAILTGKQQIAISDIPKPVPAQAEVLIKVEYCGICGSDVHAYETLMFPIGTILGHEFAGVIAEVGPGVTKNQVGDRVVVRPPGICDCEWCLKGELALCIRHFENTVGLKIPGGFEEYVVVKDYQVIKLPDMISFQQAAQFEPLAVALHAVNNSGLRVGDTVVVFGAGPIGLLTLRGAKLAGAGKLYVIDKSPVRLAMAKKFGADCVLDPDEVDIVKAVLDSEPHGVNTIFECVGKEVTLDASLNIVRKGGQIVMLGASAQPVMIDQLKWLQKGVTIRASMGYFVEDFAAAIKATSRGMYDLDSLVTEVISLDDLEEGIMRLRNPDQVLKILVRLEGNKEVDSQ